MITYQLMIAESFPKWHSRAGEPTYFVDKIQNAKVQIINPFWGADLLPEREVKKKLHTFRGDYAKWRKRFDKIERGEACLSVRVWAGVPYRSDQRVICNLSKDDGIGLQLLQFHEPGKTFTWVGEPHVDGKRVGVAQFANNDGLTVEDWIRWLLEAPKSDLTQDFALIQLTDFRYN